MSIRDLVAAELAKLDIGDITWIEGVMGHIYEIAYEKGHVEGKAEGYSEGYRDALEDYRGERGDNDDTRPSPR